MFIFNKQIFPILCVCFLCDKNMYHIFKDKSSFDNILQSMHEYEMNDASEIYMKLLLS